MAKKDFQTTKHGVECLKNQKQITYETRGNKRLRE